MDFGNLVAITIFRKLLQDDYSLYLIDIVYINKNNVV